MSYYLYRLGGAIVPKIPPAAGYFVCRVLSRFLYRLNKPGAANIRLNLQRVLGNQPTQAELNHYVRLTFENILYNYFDLFRLPGLDQQTVNRLVTVHGWEHVENALAAEKGIVMTSAHLGNIETVLYAMLLRGLSITIPVERVEPPKLFEYITALRSKNGLSLIPIDGPLLHLIRTLRRGGVAGLAGDRDITGTGQVVNFFNHPARMPDGHIRLALKTGAPIVLGFSHRNPDQSYQATFLPPFYPPETGTEEERVTASMQFILNHMENAIRVAPEQWTLTVSIWADC